MHHVCTRHHGRADSMILRIIRIEEAWVGWGGVGWGGEGRGGGLVLTGGVFVTVPPTDPTYIF